LSDTQRPPAIPPEANHAVVSTAAGSDEADFVSNVLSAAGIPHSGRPRVEAGDGPVDILVSRRDLARARELLGLIPDL
jgi:hypothetical protein